MTREQKDLLLKDLCARLPYNTKIQLTEYSDLTGEKLLSKIKILDYCMLGKVQAYCKGFRKDEIRPYLFPLSSMTEKQRKELQELHFDYISDEIFNDTEFVYHYDCMHLIDWLNKNHFDWRGLIPLDLAIDATDKNIY